MPGLRPPDYSDLPRALLDSLGEGVTIADAEGRIVFSNTTADRILGMGATDRPPEEWAAHYGVFLPDRTTPFPVEAYPLVRALRGEGTNDVEMFVRNPSVPDGVTIAVTGRPRRDEHGAISGATVVFRDVTALRRAQEQLLESNEELRRAHQLKDELMAFVIHDLNGPLTGILALTELLLLDDSVGEEVYGHLVDIRGLGQSLHVIVRNLLDLRMAEDGVLRPESDVLEVGPLIAEIHDTVRPRALLSGKTLKVEGLGRDLHVRADWDLLWRTLHNLLDNSIRYAPEGTAIRLRIDPGEEGTVRFRICDEGPGVPEHMRELIFEKYSRVERVDRGRVRESRGLGLRFCRVATEAQGGRIWVEDGAPRGVCFCVELPTGA
jgi:signal transduction histidine kinase